MDKLVSIFNDVIGPVMTGPSSSHTAGPTRIGKLAKQFSVNKLLKVDIFFETKGSFAMTYKGQRSDKGLAGGLLGWEPEDIRIANSLSEAEKSKKMPYILKHQAHLVKKAEDQDRLIDLGVLNKIIYSSMACMETSSAMGVIVAAPTAGS